ncbi:Pycsar system effector family protein [Ohtaekwangia sp.]|uniref:Pycsar system effector family protein n=1 Tax=Ohtaekwangia sp. TaxID=2066019 RepID=UPI002F94A4AC
MAETELVQKSKAYAEEILANKLPKTCVYHNLRHTQEVAKAAQEIGSALHLNDDQMETILIAAWLHDLGYLNGPADHEKESAAIAAKLLRDWNASEKKSEDVQRTILATIMPQSPKDIMGEVLCDADLSHLAKADIRERGLLLRQEIASTKNIHFGSENEWLHANLKFMKGHEYFTDYGKRILQPLKKQNIKRLKNELKPETSTAGLEDMEKELQKLRKKLEKNSRPDRGIETMFRTTLENHTNLSGMADTKANIMISINTIILSIVVSVLFRKLEDFPHLVTPTLILVLTCLLAIVMAILATRPTITKGKFTHEDIHNKKTNLLFFGNFHNMELKDYEWGMREMMKDYDYLYGSLIKDIYFLGKVLAKKYRFIRLSYTIFMFGFVASIIAFLILTMIYYQPYSMRQLLAP